MKAESVVYSFVVELGDKKGFKILQQVRSLICYLHSAF